MKCSNPKRPALSNRKNILRIAWLVALSTFSASPALAVNWKWDFSENYVSAGIADADWTIDKVFPGTKLIVDMRFIPKRDLKEPGEKWLTEEYWATVEADMQWGKGETGLEYGVFTVTAWSRQTENIRESKRKLRAQRNQLEVLSLQMGWDDPLGVESYTELSFARAGRFWTWKTKPDSRWALIGGLKGSLGWMWAESFAPQYDKVSQPFTGIGMSLGIADDVFGALYTDNHTVLSFGFSSPARSGTTGREARVRFGYYKQFKNCIAIDVFTEKRSFNFADPVLPDLYTKSRRTGVMLNCVFGKRR